MSPDERKYAVRYLEDTRQAFLESTSGLSDAQWNFREAPERWSVADCTEHMAVSEAFVFRIFQRDVLASMPRPEMKEAARGKDELMFSLVPVRSRRVQAPEHLRPVRRWPHPADAVRQFLQARDASIHFAKTSDADLRSLFAEHPFLKTLDGYQWLLFLAAHSARHTAQIREVQAHTDFPPHETSCVRGELFSREHSMSTEKLVSFAGQKYISLETLRKNGQAVATPVWFAEADGIVYVYSLAESGKMTRIRNNPRARIAPCDIRGKVTGAWVAASARLIEGDEARRADDLLNKKYWIAKRLLGFFAALRIPRRPRFYIAIRVE